MMEDFMKSYSFKYGWTFILINLRILYTEIHENDIQDNITHLYTV